MAKTRAKRTGRPRRDETREKLANVSFKADQETLDALAKLEKAFAGGINARSALIRNAIQNEAKREANRK